MEVVASREACKESVKTVVTLLASNGMCSVLCTRVDSYAAEEREGPKFYLFKVFEL